MRVRRQPRQNGLKENILLCNLTPDKVLKKSKYVEIIQRNFYIKSCYVWKLVPKFETIQVYIDKALKRNFTDDKSEKKITEERTAFLKSDLCHHRHKPKNKTKLSLISVRTW